MRFVFLSLFLALSAGCYRYSSKEGKDILDKFPSEAEDSFAYDHPETEAPKGFSFLPDPEIGKPLNPDQLQALLVERNPALLEFKYRIEALLKKADAAAKPGDMTFMTEVQRLPAKEPWRFDNVEMFMFTLSRELPLSSKLSAMAEVYVREAAAEYEKYKLKKSELIVQMMNAYFDYFTRVQEKDILYVEKDIISELIEVAIARYKSGQGGQEEILIMQAEREMIEKEVVSVEKSVRIAAIKLNTLIARDPSAALPEPVIKGTPKPLFKDDQIIKDMLANRPEIKMKKAEIKMYEAMLEAKEIEAKLPDFMVSGGYGLSPQMGDGFFGSVGISLPWFNSKRDDEVEEAKKGLSAAKAGYDAMLLESTGEIMEIIARIRSLEREIEKVEALKEIKEKNFHVTRIAYEQNRVDYLNLLEALREFYKVQIEYYMLVGMLGREIADLERCCGVPIEVINVVK